MINGVDMATNIHKLNYIKREQMFNAVIELEIQENKRTPRIIAEYASIICDKRNPYNREFLSKFGISA